MENLEIELSSGRKIELRPLSARQQMDADLSADGEQAKIRYYRIAMSVVKIDGKPPLPTPTKGPVTLDVLIGSNLQLDSIIDKFKGFEMDEMRAYYRAKFTPFMSVVMKNEYENLTVEQIVEDPSLVLNELVVQLEITGSYIIPLSSGREAELRAITAREQMCADSWANGDPTRISYFRAAMAIERLGEETFEPAQSAKDLEARIKLLSGLDIDEIGYVYNDKFSARGQSRKNVSSPPPDDSSQTP